MPGRKQKKKDKGEKMKKGRRRQRGRDTIRKIYRKHDSGALFNLKTSMLIHSKTEDSNGEGEERQEKKSGNLAEQHQASEDEEEQHEKKRSNMRRRGVT